MKLDPKALISQKEQDDLLALLDIAKGHRNSLLVSEAALDRFLRDRAPSDKGMMVDFFGDGDAKLASELTMPGGKRPKVLSEKKEEQKAFTAKAPKILPAAASVGTREQAKTLHENVKRATERYTESGNAFNDKLNRLMRRPLCRVDRCVDVFGDGLMKQVVDCTWPEPTEVFKGKITR